MDFVHTCKDFYLSPKQKFKTMQIEVQLFHCTCNIAHAVHAHVYIHVQKLWHLCLVLFTLARLSFFTARKIPQLRIRPLKGSNPTFSQSRKIGKQVGVFAFVSEEGPLSLLALVECVVRTSGPIGFRGATAVFTPLLTGTWVRILSTEVFWVNLLSHSGKKTWYWSDTLLHSQRLLRLWVQHTFILTWTVG